MHYRETMTYAEFLLSYGQYIDCLEIVDANGASFYGEPSDTDIVTEVHQDGGFFEITIKKENVLC